MAGGAPAAGCDARRGKRRRPCCRRTRRPLARPLATAQNFSTRASPIEVESWTPPQPGWLYVLDPIPFATPGPAQIELLDPKRGQVMGTISAGYNPDFALSNDGTRLYIAAAAGGRTSDLAQVDTTTGTVLGETTMSDRVEPADLAPFSTMSLSPNGGVLQILAHNGSVPESAGDYYSLATLETKGGKFFPLNIYLFNAATGGSFPIPRRCTSMFCARPATASA